MTQERISKLKAIGFVWSIHATVCEGDGLIKNGNKKRTRDDVACSTAVEDESNSIDPTSLDEAAAIAVFMETYDPLPKNPRFNKKDC